MLHFAYFWVKKGRGQTLKGRNQNLTYYTRTTNCGMFIMEKVWFYHFSIFAEVVPTDVVFFQSQPTFSSLPALLDATPNSLVKILSFSNAEFNSASIDTNLIKIERRTMKIVCHFLFAPSHFLANLIKFTFLIFLDPSGRLGTFFQD